MTNEQKKRFDVLFAEKEQKAAGGDSATKERKRALNESAARMGIKTKAGRRIFREGRRAFDPTFNNQEVA